MVVLSGKKRRHSIKEDDNIEENEDFDATEDVSESEEEFDSDSNDDEEDVKLAKPSKTAIYNRDGLIDKLNDIKWPENVDWIHSLAIDIDLEQGVDVNDDLARETAFYTQAVEGTRQAFAKLQSMGIPFLRPFDYYAEMAKSDSHMEKVKSRLLVQKTQIEEAEERRKARESKKIAKQVQFEKQKERAKEKKESIESVKKWRKQRERSGFANNKDEMPLSFEDGGGFHKKGKKQAGVAPYDRSGGKFKQFGGRGKMGMDKNKKNREFRDSKFGYGGKKGMKKQNTADTTNDFRGFRNSSRPDKKKQKSF